ncbi:MAG: Trx7/PDZ domain-containing (seleno)protein [Fuerstiella sp.]
MKHLLVALLLVCFSRAAVAQNKTRDEKVREDKAKVTEDGFWIYNDLPLAFTEARRTGKPLLVGFRCIPCEECVKLDDDLVDTDPVIRPLLEQFVCVRVVATNGLDLSLFQYDTDQSFAMFMLNADRTIYGRFGTRSHRTEWFGDVSLPGLALALQGALDLHKAYPSNKAALAGKTGSPLEFGSPEKYPSLKDKFTDKLNYKGDVAKSCIHCHQIGEARRDFYRSQALPIPDKLLYPFPHPKSLGLILDPHQMATVKSVEADSLAAKAGFKVGDAIETLNGQPLLSMADVQWVLNEASSDGAVIPTMVKRAGQSATTEISLELPAGWRKLDSIDWRVSSWGLRRMVLGGLKVETLPDTERVSLNLSSNAMALLVTNVGQYGKHATAKKAGFAKGDIIVGFNGRADLLTSDQLLGYGASNTKPGQSVDVVILRNGKRLTKRLPMQD